MENNEPRKIDSVHELLADECSWWDKCTVLHFIKKKVVQRKYRRQRAKRGYSDLDVWTLQYWFVQTLRSMLENILRHRYTYPDKITEEEWVSILQEMVQLLTVMDVDDNTTVREVLGVAADDYSKETYKQIADEQERARKRFFELFYKWYWDLCY